MATSTNPDWDPILLACQQNRLDIVERMLKEDHDHHQNNNNIVHHCNAIGQTSLHIASWWANVEIIECLLENGANILSQNTLTGATPIHCIIQSSRASIRKSKRLKSIELLLNHLLLLQKQKQQQQNNNNTTNNNKLFQQQQQFTFEKNCRDFMGRIPLDYLEEDDIDRKDIIRLFDEFENSLINQQGHHKIFDIIILIQEEKNHHNNTENLLRQQVQEIVHEQQQDQQQLLLLPTYKEKTPLVYLVEQWCNRDNNNNNDDSIDNKSNKNEDEEEVYEGNPETDITSNRDDSYYYPKSFATILPLYYFKISSSSTTSNAADNKNNNNNDQQLQQQVQQQLSIVLNILLEAILDLYIELTRKGKINNSNDDDDDDDTRLLKQWQSAVSQLFNINQPQQPQPNSVQHVIPSPSSEIEEKLWMTISRRNYIDLAEWYWSNVVVNIVAVVQDHHQVPTKDDDQSTTTTTTSASRYANYWEKIVNRQGMTPIQFAARSGHYQLVTWFLKDDAKGIDLMHKDNQGITVLDAARANEHEDIVQLLLEKMNKK